MEARRRRLEVADARPVDRFAGHTPSPPGAGRSPCRLLLKDGVFTTAANTHFSIYRNKMPTPGQRVDGAEFQRLIKEHLSDPMRIVGAPIQVGSNTVAFGWAFASGVSGTGMFHLRNGKIVFAIVNPSQFQIPFGGG